jgi:hypothetical protein
MVELVQTIAASFAAHAVFFGLIHTVAAVITLHAFDMKKIAGYHIWVDVLSTIGFTMFYAGTYTGATVGIFAGLFMTAYLSFYRYWYGYKRLERSGLKFKWFYYHNNPKFADVMPRVECT